MIPDTLRKALEAVVQFEDTERDNEVIRKAIEIYGYETVKRWRAEIAGEFQRQNGKRETDLESKQVEELGAIRRKVTDRQNWEVARAGFEASGCLLAIGLLLTPFLIGIPILLVAVGLMIYSWIKATPSK
jgi:hypothetical protein